MKAPESVPEESGVIDDVVVRGKWERVVFAIVTTTGAVASRHRRHSEHRDDGESFASTVLPANLTNWGEMKVEEWWCAVVVVFLNSRTGTEERYFDVTRVNRKEKNIYKKRNDNSKMRK